MAYKIGTITLDIAGLRTFNLGTTSTPTSATLIVQNKNGVAETPFHVSMGTYDGSGQRCTSYLKDGTTHTFDSTSKIVSHYELSGGSPVEVLSASFDSFTSTGIKLNVATTNLNYKVYIRVDY